MATLLGSRQRSFLATAALALLSAQIPSCGGDGSNPRDSDELATSDGGAPASNSSGNDHGSTAIGGSRSSATAGPSGGWTTAGGTGSIGPTSASPVAIGGADASSIARLVSTSGSSSAPANSVTNGGAGIASMTRPILPTGGAAVRSAAGGAASATTAIPRGGASVTSTNAAGAKSSGGAHSTTAAGSSATPTAGGAIAVGSSPYVVSLIQSSKANASDITQDDIKTMVTDAVSQAGGLDFIHDGMTVVLKPNLLTHLSSCWSGTATLPQSVNGVTSDWRVSKAIADLVRLKNPTGKILIMEGSNRNTTAAFAALGYTSSNFGSAVDEFIPLEGSGCTNRSNTDLVQKTGKSGKQYWVNQRYLSADILISIGAMKTHFQAGMTGCVKNLGIGATPNAMYSVSNSDSDCTRNFTQSSSTSTYIDHSFTGLGSFVSDFYSIRPADFALMDGLQGLQNGPCSSSSKDRMNMRLVLASRNAVALDTVQAAIMSCSGSKVPYLTKLEGWGLGTTDLSRISVVGNKQIVDVKKAFAGSVGGICN